MRIRSEFVKNLQTFNGKWTFLNNSVQKKQIWNSSAIYSSHKILIGEVDEYQSNCYLRPLFHFSLVFLNFSGHRCRYFAAFHFWNFSTIPVRIPITKAKCFQDFLWQRNYSVDFAYLLYIPSPYETYIGYKKGCLPLSNRKTHLGAATKTEEIESS